MEESLKIVKELAEKVKEYGGETYFVGGYVRDKLLKRKITDIDIEIHNITPERLKEILNDTTPYFECGKSFGIYSLAKYGVDAALPRKERKNGVGHRAFAVETDPFCGTYTAAKRRDFTINSMMQNVLTGEIIDCFSGMEDLKKGIIRHVDDNTFSDDPLRVLRAAQFAARFDFKTDEKTILLSKNVDLSVLSKERIAAETKKALLLSKKPSIYFKVLKSAEHISPWFEELNYSEEIFEKALKFLDRAASLRDKRESKQEFMLFALCIPFDNENRVSNFISRIFSEKSIKKYVLNMYSASRKCFYQNTKREDDFNIIKIFHTAFDKEALLDSAKIIYGENSCEYKDFKESFEKYKEFFREGEITGKDLIEIGYAPGENFSRLLKKAHSMQFKGMKKGDALKRLLSESKP